MGSRCYKYRLILKYKIVIILIILLVIVTIFNAMQVCHKLVLPIETKYYFNEPIDVVYTWVNGSDPKFLQSLNEYLRVNSSVMQDYSNQRFDDKYELKFSLRSLEKYAPWIRHVYIVTNGQIPYWLNLDHEKVTIVTHKEIFIDKFDLPTFSSPAIESHLHRIPGLSERFIYFNDDIFLGSSMFIDDFITTSRGYFIYLAWPLPMCAVDCPWVYVGDGQCDSACYNTNCQLDGGDCNLNSKIQNFWEDNYHDTITKEIIKQFYRNDFQNNSSQNISNISFNIPKQLNNSKIALKKEPIVKKRSVFLHKNITSNLLNVVKKYNENVMLNDKKFRKKRYHNDFNGSFHFGNSTFISKIRNSNLNIDAYGASLQYTNRIYNLKYGFKTRYAPAHSPIMIDKGIMVELQRDFAKEFRRTSRNKIRSEDDMQYAFSYYYYLIHEERVLGIEEIFDNFDTDKSGTWSDREIRTLLTKLYDLPLSYGTVDHFEELLLNCSKQKMFTDVSTPEFERYIDSKLPTVSKELIANCPSLSEILEKQFGRKRKYKYAEINNAQSSHVIFKMLNSNISEVVGHLDEIRRHKKKFVCLNDNMDGSKTSENELVRAILYDFYLSLFPKPSKFELPNEFRNRFLYIDELNQWKHYHLKLKICTYICIFVLCYVTYCNLLKRRILYRCINKLFC